MLQFTSVTPAKVTSVCSKHDENPKTRLAFREIIDENRRQLHPKSSLPGHRRGNLSPRRT
jgi:hypothetical protein